MKSISNCIVPRKIKMGAHKNELHPVKRTVKKYKVFPAGSFSAAGRFLCGEKNSVLFHGR